MRVRPHDPASYLLALAGVLFIAGFGLLTVEQNGLRGHVHRWQHFWWLFAVAVIGVAVALAAASVAVFLRGRRHVELEMTSGSPAKPPTKTTTPTGVIEEEIVRRFRTERRNSRWPFGGS